MSAICRSSSPAAAGTTCLMSALYSPAPKVGIVAPGFIAGAFLIQSASVLASVRYSPAPNVWRVPMCVRLGPFAWSSLT